MKNSQNAKGSESTTPAAQSAEIKRKENSNPTEAGSVDKIRDILFGNQARDYEKRFEKMHDAFIKETSDLKDELHQRIENLETYIKQEVKDINDRLKNEASNRTEGLQSLQNELKDNVEKLSQKLLAEQENIARKSTQLREQILEQSKTLTSDILKKHEQAQKNLEKTEEELDGLKVNRSDLSGFFLEIAMRLSGDDSINFDGNAGK